MAKSRVTIEDLLDNLEALFEVALLCGHCKKSSVEQSTAALDSSWTITHCHTIYNKELLLHPIYEKYY
eukprot:6873634-Ditylum_brightwellii.AAC.1